MILRIKEIHKVFRHGVLVFKIVKNPNHREDRSQDKHKGLKYQIKLESKVKLANIG